MRRRTLSLISLQRFFSFLAIEKFKKGSGANGNCKENVNFAAQHTICGFVYATSVALHMY